MKYLLLVPVYNAAHLLPFFFQSIRDMNPKPDRIVWAVNNCTDNTVPMLKAFNDVPSELIELPDFPRDFVKKHGAFEAIAIVRQRLWERARELDAEWTFMCDVDEFAVSTDILGILSDWNVDFVAARVIVGTAFAEEIGRLDACWLGHILSDGYTYRTRKVPAIVYKLASQKLIIARPAFPEPNALYSNLLGACGFYCFSRKLVQDHRLNWHPLTGADDGTEIGEDIEFCCNARNLGYVIHLDGIALVNHVIYDEKRRLKPWSKNFEFGEKANGA
ncbi:MAG: glycosyltransferase family 2 protein [Candidatus Bathyarchaeota archaeon]|nr:glycosyltransferase family 2 protein [Candidatus Bathyarchaeota archaeon]